MTRAALLILTACLTAPAAWLGAQPAPQAAARYRIDAAASDIRLLVYRAGPLARAGHNHVVSPTRIEGLARVAPGLVDSDFELVIPVAALGLDDPALRREEGAEFESVPSARDIEQTRANMLGPRVLDAAQHADIRVTGRLREAEGGAPQLALALELAGHASTLTVPVGLSVTADQLVVEGEFTVSHGALGLTPYRVLLGALQVAEDMRLKFRVIARRERGP